jgi:hypothetical protein
LIAAVQISDDIEAHLIIEVDGNNREILMSEMEAISEMLTQYDTGEIYFAMMHSKKMSCGN